MLTLKSDALRATASNEAAIGRAAAELTSMRNALSTAERRLGSMEAERDSALQSLLEVAHARTPTAKPRRQQEDNEDAALDARNDMNGTNIGDDCHHETAHRSHDVHDSGSSFSGLVVGGTSGRADADDDNDGKTGEHVCRSCGAPSPAFRKLFDCRLSLSRAQAEADEARACAVVAEEAARAVRRDAVASRSECRALEASLAESAREVKFE